MNLESFKNKIFLDEFVKYNGDKIFLQEIKLCKGRFENYDINYIDADIAKIITDFQKSYKDFLSALEKEIGVKFTQKDKLISFKIQKGSVLLSADIFNEVLELLNTLESGDKMIIIVVGILAFSSFMAWHTFLKNQIEKLKIQTQNKENEAKNKQIKKVLKILDKMLENMNMQKASNSYKENIRKSLRDNEFAYINEEKITNRSDFENIVIRNDEEEIRENYYKIVSYNFLNKSFKIDGIGAWVNASIIDEESREKIIQEAKKNEPIELRIKTIKDKNTGEYREAYILQIARNLFD